jgi:hypothetical protein
VLLTEPELKVDTLAYLSRHLVVLRHAEAISWRSRRAVTDSARRRVGIGCSGACFASAAVPLKPGSEPQVSCVQSQ